MSLAFLVDNATFSFNPVLFVFLTEITKQKYVKGVKSVQFFTARLSVSVA